MLRHVWGSVSKNQGDRETGRAKAACRHPTARAATDDRGGSAGAWVAVATSHDDPVTHTHTLNQGKRSTRNNKKTHRELPPCTATLTVFWPGESHEEVVHAGLVRYVHLEVAHHPSHRRERGAGATEKKTQP